MARDKTCEPLPLPFMTHDPFASNIRDEPPEAIMTRILLATLELGYSPHLLQARSMQQSFRVKRCVPFSRVKIRKIQTSVRCRVHGGRDPLLVLQLAFHKPVTSGTIWNNIGLAHHSGRGHAQRLKYSLVEKIPIELACDAVNHYSKRQISEVAIAPVSAGLKC